MVSSSPEASSASDLKADDPKAQVETMDLVPMANCCLSMLSLSAAGAHSSDNNTPPPYEEPSRNDNADDNYTGSGEISSGYVMNDRRPLLFPSNPANTSSSGRNMGRKCNFSPLHLAIMVLGTISAVVAVSWVPNVASQPAAHARIRDKWDNEVHAHEALQNWKHEYVAQAQRHQEEEVEWEREIQARVDLHADWVRTGSDIPSLLVELQHEKVEWDCERLAQVERRQEEEVEWDKEVQAHETLRADWARERNDVEALRADLQREKVEWDRERLAQVECRREEEVEWDKELQAHKTLRADWARERNDIKADLQHEKMEWKRQRAAEKRHKEDERARTHAGFHWEDLTPDQHCHMIPFKRARRPPTIEIPGVKIQGRPLKCEDRGCSSVFGYWITESGESICATYFKTFDDKGCTSPGSRRRRIQSHLENLQSEDDGPKMCSTTPATFCHQHFPKPDTCDIGLFGVWGVWEIKDDEC
ncbi:hypothetical protein DFH07DRAFT_951696 [Mycena maculata]|uniref:Uncharacterized protein n=1 Tax=Mycena maculata TaxID=230809 RepID=A0AAD7NV89_9AGAR|nr:hypothetical protein DFH07DRAFT_951696 [Mycena maculata]